MYRCLRVILTNQCTRLKITACETFRDKRFALQSSSVRFCCHPCRFFAIFSSGKVFLKFWSIISICFSKHLPQFSSKHIEIVFDTYKTPSIKNAETNRRPQFSSQNLECSNQGKDQIFLQALKKLLLNKQFRQHLIKF